MEATQARPAPPAARPGWSAREEAAWQAGPKVGARGLAEHVRAWFARQAERERLDQGDGLGVRPGESAGFRLLAEIGRLTRRAGELDPGGFLANDLGALRRLAEAALAEG